ncbi:GGDEF domain-containing protein [Pseudomonas sp. UBA6276]|uniref:GGDEF domain-containing protein n=1 Tax=Pseudomonas sp. UBA6276 TaxID=1947324 RepID=UPI00257FC840|nr:diguanylate cyclase [Pseudomonas sp. UBA6276]
MRTHLLRQPSHYLFVLPAVLVAVGLWGATPAAEVGNPVHRLLPLVLACLGIGLALIYARVRAVCLMLAVALAFALLHGVVGTFLREGVISDHTPLIFHAVSWWLPLLFLVHGLWPERGRQRQDLLLRGVVSGTALGVFLLLAAQGPDGMQALLSDRHLAWMPSGWNALAQLPALLFMVATLALAVQAWHQPRPLHTALLTALLCLWWMLPRVFVSPALLPAVSCMALLLIVSAMLQEAFHMAFRDELTGLPGRRAFNECLQRVGPTYTIAMVDVDHFKRFNDLYGHPAGDECIKAVGQAVLSCVGRSGDLVVRYGGEEILVLLPESDETGAWQVAEKVLLAVRALAIAHAGSDLGIVTISAGVHVWRNNDPDAGAQNLVEAADQALYRAKTSGRNRVYPLQPLVQR